MVIQGPARKWHGNRRKGGCAIPESPAGEDDVASVHPSPGTTPNGAPPDLAAFVSENPNPVLSCGPDGGVTYANPAAHRLAAALGLGSPADLLPPGHGGRVRACLAAGRPQQRIEVRLGGRVFSWDYLPVLGCTAVHVYGGEITDLVRVRQHRGAIRVHTAPGRGTRVRVMLPSRD